jgi:hypothetical protein
MESKPEGHAGRIRNTLILVYLAGNAATFSKIVAGDAAGIRATGELFWPIMKALALAMAWPVYWLWRALEN